MIKIFNITICSTMFHDYKQLENGMDMCIKCGKHRPLPFFPFGYEYMKLTIACRLWELRGLQTCPHHGFNSQSFITGFCKECNCKEWSEEAIKKSEECLDVY